MTNDLNTPEPAPKPTDSRPVWELVIEDMQARDIAGRAKYGTPLQAGNGRKPLVDAYQEVLDLAVYLRQAIEERGEEPNGLIMTDEELADELFDAWMDPSGPITSRNAWLPVAVRARELLAPRVAACTRDENPPSAFPAGSGRIDTFKALPEKPAEEWPRVMVSPNGHVVVSIKRANNVRAEGMIWADGVWSPWPLIDAAEYQPSTAPLPVAAWRSLPSDIDRQAPGIRKHEPLPRVALALHAHCIVTGFNDHGPCGLYYVAHGGRWRDNRVALRENDGYSFDINRELAPGELMPARHAAALRKQFPDIAAHHNIAPDLPPPTAPQAIAVRRWGGLPVVGRPQPCGRRIDGVRWVENQGGARWIKSPPDGWATDDEWPAGMPLPRAAWSALEDEHHEYAEALPAYKPPEPKIVAWDGFDEAVADGLRPGVAIKLPSGVLVNVYAIMNDEADFVWGDGDSEVWSFREIAKGGWTFADSGKPCGRAEG